MPRPTPELQREYQRNWMKERRALFMTGKVCSWCGSSKRIENHHIDPSQKESHNIWSWSFKRIEAELAKCIPLCRVCHMFYHGLQKTHELRHGTEAGYKKKCRCDRCRYAHRMYVAAWRRGAPVASVKEYLLP